MEDPILPEKIWTNNEFSNNNFNNYPQFAKSNNNILELLDELTFSKPEKVFDALDFFKDEGYDTNSDSELESDNEFVKIGVNNFKASKFKSLAI
ncbi:hypothetical protein [Spiroplasma endosymbiont of Polydrusus pterygomalis]|uniref:hypothetical protein n=1 Tax=Spiroplasma endosymbiont of Polydrusus pterygomalis TaxID=3139327 RepID=UPI003CCA7585